MADTHVELPDEIDINLPDMARSGATWRPTGPGDYSPISDANTVELVR